MRCLLHSLRLQLFLRDSFCRPITFFPSPNFLVLLQVRCAVQSVAADVGHSVAVGAVHSFAAGVVAAGTVHSVAEGAVHNVAAGAQRFIVLSIVDTTHFFSR